MGVLIHNTVLYIEGKHGAILFLLYVHTVIAVIKVLVGSDLMNIFYT
jgi:hypothetical protein